MTSLLGINYVVIESLWCVWDILSSGPRALLDK